MKEKSEKIYNMAPKILWPIWIPIVIVTGAVMQIRSIIRNKL